MDQLVSKNVHADRHQRPTPAPCTPQNTHVIVTQTDKHTKLAKNTRHHVKLWIPDQPGAWTMALLPAVGGVCVGGPSWRNCWMLAAWALCYCLDFTAARWLAVRSHEAGRSPANLQLRANQVPRSDPPSNHTTGTPSMLPHSRSRAFLTPVLVYAFLVAAVGLPLLALTPELLWYAVPFAALATLSLLAAWRRQERTLWGNAVSVLAAGCITLVATAIGNSNYPHNAGLWPIFGLVHDDTDILGSPLLPVNGIIAAVAFILTEYASVLFVKTMIREHGNKKYYILSLTYHLTLFALTSVYIGFKAPIGLIALHARPTGLPASKLDPIAGRLWLGAALILLLRAVFLPLTRKRLKPLHIGIVEIFTSLMNFVCIVAALG
ncbi:YwiC-like protein [Bifidobacterium bohemicum]|uniref:YwiC-like protein family protein n=1 Tax=Bifidobacterium bohemicum DSM 22767 TaxID=1437606 RepID=A0A086ZHN1_9BIFI|nr:YwiC-like family protein [Bifidobacterium bohemicum]KFI46031.1 YwiC-like protein family protein [Bifidobacterium bohemicum DSM 22767]SCC05184.1 YwiC-like protein [Bifidobacterium bohemicum]